MQTMGVTVLRGHLYPRGQVDWVAGVAQKDPAAHGCGAIDDCGQNVPLAHATWVAGVAQ